MPLPKKRILFVDDERSVLAILEIVMQRCAVEWEAQFAGSGREALEMCAKTPFDVVVCDMRMAGMSGLEVLSSLMVSNPRTIRVVMSGHADEDVVQESVGVAHQWMTKPFELAVLNQMLSRISTAEARIREESFKSVVGRIRNLPSPPATYFRIIEAQQSPSCSTQTIGEIVTRDPGLTANLLKLINSAFFGPARHVTDPMEAVQFLGISRIRSLTLMHHIVSKFDGHDFADLQVEQIWDHSLRTAFLARRFASWRRAGKRIEDEAFTAGLLHDIGHIILAANLPREFRLARARAHEKGLAWHVAEREVIGTTHANLGAYLLGIWGLPPALTEAVARHEEPSLGTVEPTFGSLAAVHVASVWSYEKSPMSATVPATPLDHDYLRTVGVDGELDSWRDRLINEL